MYKAIFAALFSLSLFATPALAVKVCENAEMDYAKNIADIKKEGKAVVTEYDKDVSTAIVLVLSNKQADVIHIEWTFVTAEVNGQVFWAAYKDGCFFKTGQMTVEQLQHLLKEAQNNGI